MNQTLAILSMLHESATHNSALLRFRQRPVIAWTLDRIAQIPQAPAIRIFAWTDQLEALARALPTDVKVVDAGPRRSIGLIETVSAARRWSDGWRGGILGTTAFDSGFQPHLTLEMLNQLSADAALLINPADGLIDPALLRGLLDHAADHPAAEMCFLQAPPGLAGAFLRRTLVERLARVNLHPGRLLHYLPDQPARDPLAGEGCAPVPLVVARSSESLRLDSVTHIAKIEHATMHLNGQLIHTEAEALLETLRSGRRHVSVTRDVRLEITTRRTCRPVFDPMQHVDLKRDDLSLDSFNRWLSAQSAPSDLRITFVGTGDPLLHPELPAMLLAARSAGVRAIAIETDLLSAPDDVLGALVTHAVDIVSIHLPATSPQVYEKVMGVNGMGTVLANLKRLIELRMAAGRHLPLIVPTFIKLEQNLGDMEAWYDQWMRAVGWAVIKGPTDYAAQMPRLSVADMSPPKRSSCRRLTDSFTILSNGAITACEEDVLGVQALGHVGAPDAQGLRHRLQQLLDDHHAGRWSAHRLCGACTEWHRS